MSRAVEKSSAAKWVVAYGADPDIVHFVKVHPGSVCDTGQPSYEIFNTEEEAKARVLELDPTYFDEAIEEDGLEVER